MADPRHMHEFQPNRRGKCKTIVGHEICHKEETAPEHVRYSRMVEGVSSGKIGPLEQLPFPVMCTYEECGEGPFLNGIEVDEHITEEHLCETVWSFAFDNMKRVK